MNNTAEYCIAGTRIQGLTAPAATAAECAVEQTQQKTFNSTIDGLRKIARNEGFTTLWRGLSPTLVMAIPANIIYFTGYEWLRFNTTSPIYKVTKDEYAPLVAGSVAVPMLIIVRSLQGFGVGMLLCLVPLYLSEVAPPKRRGLLTGLTATSFGLGFTW